MRAIILSAGQGRRLLPETAAQPKCLVPVRGRESLLELQLQALEAAGVREALVAVGYHARRVEASLAGRRPGLRTRTLYNPFHDRADNLVTCWLAREAMEGPFLLLNGDTLFDPQVVRNLLAAPPAPLRLAVNEKADYDADDMKVSRAPDGRLRAVGKSLDPSIVDGESIGLMLFREPGSTRFRGALERAVRAPEARSAWYLSVVDALAATLEIQTLPITGLWWREVDSPQDLAEARAELEGVQRNLPAPSPPRRVAAPRRARGSRRSPRVGILNNLRAGRNDGQVGRILSLLRDHPDVSHVETSSAGAVPEALEALAAEDVEVLVVNGGDGTVQRVLTEVLAHDSFGGRRPLIAPLRGGRTNMTALDLGTHRDPVRAVVRLLRAAREGRIEEHVVERRVLRVEYGPRDDVLCGMFFGAGLIHRAIELTLRVFPKGRAQGVFGGTVVTGALLTRAALLQDGAGILAPDKIQALLDDRPLDRGELTLAIASSLDRLFAGMRPFWGEGPGGVRFTCIASGAPALWRTVPGILRGRPGRWVRESPGYTSRNVSCARLRMDCGFTVDGELVAPEPGRTLSIRANRTVRFLRG